MATEPLLGFPYPAGSGLVGAGDDDIRALAEAVRLRAVLIFASSAARSSAFSAASITLGASHKGLFSHLQDVDRYERWNGALWIPVDYTTGAIVATSQTTTSTSYTDLTTVGPAVTLTTGTQALVSIVGTLSNSVGTNHVAMSFAVSGATTVAASDPFSIFWAGSTTLRLGATFLVTGLTAGSNTFTAKYRVSISGTGTFVDRNLCVRTAG